MWSSYDTWHFAPLRLPRVGHTDTATKKICQMRSYLTNRVEGARSNCTCTPFMSRCCACVEYLRNSGTPPVPLPCRDRPSFSSPPALALRSPVVARPGGGEDGDSGGGDSGDPRRRHLAHHHVRCGARGVRQRPGGVAGGQGNVRLPSAEQQG